MDLTTYIDRVHDELVRIAEVGGDAATTLASQLTLPLESALRMVLLDALSDAAALISSELAPGSVEVRLRSGEPDFAVQLPAAEPAGMRGLSVEAPQVPPDNADDDDHELARISLRIAGGVKRRVDRAADEEGVSTNTWISRAIVAALDQRGTELSSQHRRTSSSRVTGWVQ